MGLPGTVGVSAAAGQKIWLRGGSNVKGTVLGGDDKFIAVSIMGGVVNLPVESFAVVDFVGEWENLDDILGRSEGVPLHRVGDSHEAAFKGFDDEGS